MPTHKPHQDRKSLPALRERAEALLRTKRADTPTLATEDVQALVHQLNVHQIELEMQNEELRQAQVELAHTRDRYADLYEFAPVGYVTLDKEGKILEANLTAATMLGVERQSLIGANISKFLNQASQDACYLHRREVFSRETKQTCVVEMHRADGPRLAARLESIAFGAGDERCCRMAIVDVTAARDAQQQLQESEERYRRLTEALTDYIYHVRVEKGRAVETFHEANCETITGYTPQEFAANPQLWIAMVPEEDRAMVESQASYILSGKASPPIEHRIRRKDGAVRWVLNTISPQRDERGTLIGYDGLVRDITLRKDAEVKLKQLHEELEQRVAERTQETRLLAEAVSHLGEGVLVTSDDLDWPGPQIVFVNEAMCRITGYTVDELIRQTPRILQGDATEQEPVERLKSELSAGRPCSVEMVNYRKDGTPYDAEVFITPLYDVEGRRTNFVAIHRDITERKRSERESARLAAVVESSSDAIARKSLDGTIETWNPGAERIYGYSAAEAVGQSDLMLVPPERVDELGEILARSERGERVDHFETVRVRKDGRRIDVSLTISPILDTRGRLIGASAIARDISKQKEAERSLRQKTQTLATIGRVSRILASELELDKVLQSVTDAGSELTGALFGAFFYNEHDANGEGYLLHAVSGVPSERFAGFPMPRSTELFGPTLRGETVVRLDDVTADPRYGKNPPYHGTPEGHLPVRSYLAVPVVSRTGEVHGGLFFGHSEVGVFTHEHEELTTVIAAEAAIAIDNARLYEAARRERDRIQQYLDLTGSLMVALDRDERVALANRRACDVLGYTEADVVGKDWFEHFLPARLREEVREVFGQIIQGQMSPVEFHENPVLTADGQERIIEWHNAELRDPDGQVVGVLGSGMDVTERRRAEEALRESEERMALAVRATRDAVWDYDLVQGTAWWNEIYEELCGPRPAGSSWRWWLDHIHPEDRRRVRNSLREALRGKGDAWECEYRYRRPDGSYAYAQDRAYIARDPGGKAKRILGSMHDFTARRKAEEQRRLLAAAVSQLEEGVVITDARLDHPGPQIVFVNEAVGRMTGYDAGELLGRTPRVFQGGKTDRAVLEELRKALAERRPFQCELINYRKDGTEFDVEIGFAAVLDDAGRIVNYVSVHRDISERKRIERALRASEERLRAIVTTAADGIVTIDGQGVVTSFNPAAARMFGYSAEEMIGRSLKLLMPSPYAEEYDDYISRYLRTGEARIIGIGRELTARRKDASTFPIDLAVSEIGHLGLFTGIIRDISERKRLEEEVLRAAEDEQRRIGQELHDDAQQRLAGLGMLARSIALTLPTDSIADLDERELPKLQQRADFLARGINDVNRRVHLLARGLVPSEIEAHGLHAAFAELAANTSELYSIACRFEGDNSVDVKDNFVATHLYRIVQEALNNTVKHAQSDEVMLSLERADAGILLTVRDYGIGLPADGAGKGRGLSIMSYRANLVGGILRIGPALGGGTAVSCFLPDPDPRRSPPR